MRIRQRGRTRPKKAKNRIQENQRTIMNAKPKITFNTNTFKMRLAVE